MTVLLCGSSQTHLGTLLPSGGRSHHQSHAEGPCCTNRLGDSLHESSMIAGRHEQLGPYEVQDHELVGLQ